MKTVFTIAAKEIRSTFVTPLAYIVIAGFMIVAGFFFFSLLEQFNAIIAQASMMRQASPNLNEWVVVPYYQTLELVVLFLIPILTMRTITEEKKNGTFELLITSPIKVADVTLGKFLGLFVVILCMLLTAFIFSGLLAYFADPEVKPIFVGFLGIVLFSTSLAALGMGISACAQSQTVAGVVSLVTLLIFYVIDAPASRFNGVSASVLKYLSPANHTQTFINGVIESGDIVYFLSVILVGLFLSSRALEAHRWR